MRNTGYRILAENQATSNDTWDTGRNNNDLIIGPSGAGKTRGYVLPNILQCSESLVVTDTKGALYGQVGHVLARHGYDDMCINLADCLSSPWGYNPLEYVRYDARRDKYSEQDIMTIAAAIVPDEPRNDDPYWHRAARMLLESLIGYVMECLPTDEQNLCSVVKLFRCLNDGTFDRLTAELGEIAPDSFSVGRYGMVSSCRRAEKMFTSVIGILAEKLSVLSFDGAAARRRSCPANGELTSGPWADVEQPCSWRFPTPTVPWTASPDCSMPRRFIRSPTRPTTAPAIGWPSRYA